MKRTLALPIALAALGCSAAPGPGEQAAARPVPSPYESNLGASLAPTLSPDEVGNLVPQMMQLAASIDPAAILAAFLALDARADPSCPEEQEQYPTPAGDGTTKLWSTDRCASADGTSFKGASRLTTFSRALADGTLEDGFELSNEDFHIEAVDGTFVRGALYMERRASIETNGAIFHSVYFQGRLTADAATAGNDPWLRGELSGELSVAAGDFGQARSAYFGGSLRPTPDAAVTAVAFSDVAIETFECARGTSGRVALRDAAGGWHDADFGAEDDATAPCDACGDLSFGGAPLGTFCADAAKLDNLLAWETIPW